jgi:hypothetical protein
MNRRKAYGIRASGGLVVGGLILFLGIMFTLDNLKLLEANSILRWWPLVLIVLGARRMLAKDRSTGQGFGLFVMVVGGLLLLVSLDLIDSDPGDLIFPLLLILLGGHLVARSLFRSKHGLSPGEKGDALRTVAVMSGIERKHASPDFRGGDAAAVMGGAEIDLREARMPSGQAVIDVFAFWGAVEIRVPPDWRVTGEVFPLMGAFEDNTKSPAESTGNLIVRGLVVMGGVEVKN